MTSQQRQQVHVACNSRANMKGLMEHFMKYPLVIWNNYGKSPCSIEKSTINGPFAIVLSNYQRVNLGRAVENPWKLPPAPWCWGLKQGWEIHYKWRIFRSPDKLLLKWNQNMRLQVIFPGPGPTQRSTPWEVWGSAKTRSPKFSVGKKVSVSVEDVDFWTTLIHWISMDISCLPGSFPLYTSNHVVLNFSPNIWSVTTEGTSSSGNFRRQSVEPVDWKDW